MKKYAFRFTTQGQKSIFSLPQTIQQRIITKLKKMESTEDIFTYAEKLTGYNNHYKVRIGNYRVIFIPEKNTKITILLVIKIGHRKDIYKKL